METFATKNITDIEKYKKLNMTEDKTDMNITEIEKYETLDMTFTLTGH